MAKKTLIEEISLNEKSQPLTIKRYGSNGKVKAAVKFEYENGILKKYNTSKKSISVTYQNGQMVLSKNVGDADDTEIYYLENDELLRKSYTIMRDENFSNMNTFTEETIKDNCIHYHINNELWTISCNSKTGIFPFNYLYTSYQNGKILQEKKYIINKKSDTLYELSFSNDSNEKPQIQTYHLNERNLLTGFDFSKNGEAKKIEVQYTYYP